MVVVVWPFDFWVLLGSEKSGDSLKNGNLKRKT